MLGFFELWRLRVQTRLGWGTFLLFMLSLVVAFFVSIETLWPFALLPLGVTGISVTMFFIWATFSVYTDVAAQIKAQWEAFKRFMSGVTARDQSGIIAPLLFADCLPFAASFGLLVLWAKALQRQGIVALPEWFKRLIMAESPDRGLDEDSMVIFVEMVQTTHELTHPSGSSGSSSVSGSSGAAGGGSSSAG